MAIIHKTTMVPGKLDLLSTWLPSQPWYAGQGREPVLARAGGFRLDDPAGEVGIEFMVVTDGHGEEGVTYQVPLTYRGAALPGAAASLIGTSEHGVLGRRWIYDGAADPVLPDPGSPAGRAASPDAEPGRQPGAARCGRTPVPFRTLAAA